MKPIPFSRTHSCDGCGRTILDSDETLCPRCKGKPCRGTYRNGPEKRYARCSSCGRIDYEANEGDRCRG